MKPESLLDLLPPSETERAAFLLRDLAEIHSDAPRSFIDMGSGSGSMAALICLRYSGIQGVLVDVVSRLTYLDHLSDAQRALLECFSDPNDARLRDRRFDLVCSMDVLEHIPNWRNEVRSLKRWVAADGYLYIQVPSNYPSPNYPFRGVLKNRVAGFFNRNDPATHLRHGLSVKSIADAISDEFDLVVASESYVVDGEVPCKFKPRTHVLGRRKGSNRGARQ
jgi:SAM-dependent methyltransferase